MGVFVMLFVLCFAWNFGAQLAKASTRLYDDHSGFGFLMRAIGGLLFLIVKSALYAGIGTAAIGLLLLGLRAVA